MQGSSPLTENGKADATRGPLSPEEFRSLYLENMRRKFEEARQREAAGLPQVPAMSPRPQETRAEVPPIFRPDRQAPFPPPPQPQVAENAQPIEEGNNRRDLQGQWLSRLMNLVIQITIAAFLLSQGDFGSSFVRMFCILAVVKFAAAFFGRFRLQRNRLAHENDVRAEGERVVLTGRRKWWYMMWKSAVTFFVSMYPTFRVEALEMELRMDGLDHNARVDRQRAPDREPHNEALPQRG
jgi:hypothetical protein